jgi:uncharacterized membrane protein YraQ (UPF0718 family)
MFEKTYTLRIISNFITLIWTVAPYFFISVLIGVTLIYYFPKKSLAFNTQNEIFTILIAGIMGLISPLPTYIAVPISISFLSIGIPFSAVITFVIASPLMNPSIFFLTYNLLGPGLAIARTLTALITALGSGFLCKYIFTSFQEKIKIKTELQRDKKRPFLTELWHYFLFMGKYFVIAIFIGSAVKALVPAELITRLLGGQAKAGLLIAIAMGVPFYSCGGAAIPLIEVLIELGMDKGAALAFFIAGPATKLETLYIFKSRLSMRILIFYLMVTFTASFLSGSLYSKL